jgi:hypothetical protein
MIMTLLIVVPENEVLIHFRGICNAIERLPVAYNIKVAAQLAEQQQ